MSGYRIRNTAGVELGRNSYLDNGLSSLVQGTNNGVWGDNTSSQGLKTKAGLLVFLIDRVIPPDLDYAGYRLIIHRGYINNFPSSWVGDVVYAIDPFSAAPEDFNSGAVFSKQSGADPVIPYLHSIDAIDWGGAANPNTLYADGYNVMYQDYDYSGYARPGIDLTVYIADTDEIPAAGNYLVLLTQQFGVEAHSEGYHTIAGGDASHSEGANTHAAGHYSHAEGVGTIATGPYSHAEGNSTQALNMGSHAEGYETRSYGKNSHAEGWRSIARGVESHAEGHVTVSSGTASHSEGTSTLARGSSSHAEGDSSKAYGDASHAEGNNTRAYEPYSHAEGSESAAYAEASHAEGNLTIAKGTASHSEGASTIAKGDYSHAEGKESYSYGESSHAEGMHALSYGQYSHAEGIDSKAGFLLFDIYDTSLDDYTGFRIYLQRHHANIANGPFIYSKKLYSTGADHISSIDTLLQLPNTTPRINSSIQIDYGVQFPYVQVDSSTIGFVSAKNAFIGVFSSAPGSGGWFTVDTTLGSYPSTVEPGTASLIVKWTNLSGVVNLSEWNEGATVYPDDYPDLQNALADGNQHIIWAAWGARRGLLKQSTGFLYILDSGNSDAAHAEGIAATASSAASHAQGEYTVANAVAASASGKWSEASGVASHAGGIKSKAKHVGEQASASGSFNKVGDAQTMRLDLMGLDYLDNPLSLVLGSVPEDKQPITIEKGETHTGTGILTIRSHDTPDLQPICSTFTYWVSVDSSGNFTGSIVNSYLTWSTAISFDIVTSSTVSPVGTTYQYQFSAEYLSGTVLGICHAHASLTISKILI